MLIILSPLVYVSYLAEAAVMTQGVELLLNLNKIGAGVGNDSVSPSHHCIRSLQIYAGLN